MIKYTQLDDLVIYDASGVPCVAYPVVSAEVSDMAVVDCDVVEWPRLSQAVRLEREQATHSYHIYDIAGHERGIFYTLSAALRFTERHGFCEIDEKPILREMP